MLLVLLLFNCLPLWITARHWGKLLLLLRVVHEITGVELSIERIGHCSVHEPGKKDGKKEIRTHRCFIAARDSRSRVLSVYDRTMGMRHQDPGGALSSVGNFISFRGPNAVVTTATRRGSRAFYLISVVNPPPPLNIVPDPRNC